MKGLLIVVLVCIAHDVLSQHYQGNPLVKNYPVKELGSQVFNIVQDDRGVMYFGIGKGVVEYDGKYWREIPLPSKVQAYSLAKSNEGIIYLGGTNDFGYLTLDAQGKTVFADLTHLIKKEIIIGDVYSVKNTNRFVYFHTLTHIFQYDKNNKAIITFEGEPNGFALGNFVIDDTYFFRGLEKGLLKIENNQIVKAPHSDFFKDQDKTTFLFGSSPYDAHTQLIIGFNPNIHLYSPSSTPPKSIPLESQDFLKDNFPYSSTTTQDGYYHFLGSLGKGGILINKQGKILQHYNKQTGIGLDEILNVYADKQQNFWLGLANGISKTEHSLDLIHWNNTHHYKGDMFYTYLHENKLYVLTSQEIFVIAPDQSPVFLKGGTTHMQKWGMEMLHVAGASKMIVAAGGGLYELINNKVIPIYQSENHKFFIHKSKSNPNRLISTEGHTLLSFRYENNQWVEEGIWKNIGRDNIRKIAETKEGEIWLGTQTKGIVKVIPDLKNIREPLNVFYYGLEHGLPTLNYCVPIIYQNKILVGTEKGLYIYLPQKDRFEPFCELGTQFCDGRVGVYHLIEAIDNNIYIAPLNGQVIDVKIRKDSEPISITQPFKRIPKMRIDKIEVDSQGIVWIAGEEGIFRYDARHDTKDYTQSFLCLIRKVSIYKDSVIYWGNDRGRTELQSNAVSVTNQQRDIKFEFAAPFFDNEEKTLYSYYLEGYEEEWSAWSDKTEKEYTNLWEATYTFKAKAKNIYGVESTVASYTFIILPPWYRTWWAYLSYFIVAIAGSSGISNIYHHRLIKKKVSLEKIVQERTNQISQQNQELQQQKKEIETQAEHLSQLNHTKDKLFAILSHDLRTPINSLTGLMDLVSHKSISEQVLQMYTDKLKINVKQVHFTLNNLLFWAKGQMQGLIIKPQSIALHALVERNFSLAHEIALAKRIELINLVHQNIQVWADADHIDIVVRNLINNAIKFTPPDGIIHVEVSSKSNVCEISVQDNGAGITAENLTKIFRFNLAFTTHGTDGEKGTGLGLSICKELVEMNGGQIWVESELDKGTKILFTLPCTQAS